MKLPDVNLLVASSVAQHVHHGSASKWVKKESGFATCPVTELGLLRVLMQLGTAPEDADAILGDIVTRHRARLVPADISATSISGLATGHRQTTDVYLVELARAHQLKVVTFDRALASRFPRLCEAVP